MTWHYGSRMALVLMVAVSAGLWVTFKWKKWL